MPCFLLPVKRKRGNNLNAMTHKTTLRYPIRCLFISREHLWHVLSIPKKNEDLIGRGTNRSQITSFSWPGCILCRLHRSFQIARRTGA